MQEQREVKTILEYQNDTYKYESTGILLEHGCDSNGLFLIFDSTIFHPQGGGQPSDTGVIMLDSECKDRITVKSVIINEGVVKHYIIEALNNLDQVINKKCILQIDENRRITNAKAHTAGHLLGSIMGKLEPDLHTKKGYHFPEGPNLEFHGLEIHMTREELKNQLQKLVDNALQEGAEIQVYSTEETNEKKCSKMRYVQINGYKARPCGGTHLKNINELKTVTVKKLTCANGNLKLSYGFS